MPNEMEALELEDIASLLGVSERMVRNYIKDNNLPCRQDGRKRLFVWNEVREWYVAYRIDLAGSRGSLAPQIPVNGDNESLEEAILRKTKAEADIKELQLAEMRKQVASIEDVEKVLTSANLATKTQIEALPSKLAIQLIGIDDQGKIHGIIQRETFQLLTNLATIETIKDAAGAVEDGE